MIYSFGAGQYWQAATVIYNRLQSQNITEGFLPFYFLCGQSIELSLKGYLRAKGFTQAQLQDQKFLGHKLLDCLKEAQDRGFSFICPLTLEEFQLLILLDGYHKKHDFRFPEAGQKSYPKSELLLPLTKRFYEAAQTYCQANNKVHHGTPSAEIKQRIKPLVR